MLTTSDERDAQEQLIKSVEKGLGFVVVQFGPERQSHRLLKLTYIHRRDVAKFVSVTAQTKARQL
jgi:predicted dinucleotide-binding enzyme